MKSLVRSGLLVVLALAGCGSDDANPVTADAPPGSQVDAAPTADAGPSTQPTVAISVGPLGPSGIMADGTLDNGANITVTVTNFTLTNPFAGDARIANVAGQGSYNLSLDAETAVFASGHTGNLQIPVPVGTQAGPHTLKVTMLQNDGTAVSPALTATSMSFTIQ